MVHINRTKNQTTLYYISTHPRTTHLKSLSSYHHQLQIDSQKIHLTKKCSIKLNQNMKKL